ncbi:glucose 1-dehydrogenase [Mesorhizobium sp. VK23B]|uniref:Glucose 1-dehydrogenase n=1 Tax=Mesorhizobium dulcispinae TaxID=3072316 RepID=A0ABU4XPI7_9HYPH|nr:MULTISPECIES: glucose 1-dehydrogenase [unclassified Mesorhizobium]MDX8470276.1 glucose 1-dehydrogenase [Mesorhizobium sp. VK23B]MDX8476669.1 glucose 1-dehydrogenase [Mesorhizobium sp. VK23A]
MAKLEGKIAVVTGGSSGIGFAVAQRFAAEGAHVFITGRRQAELDKAAAEIGYNVSAVQGDVSSLADLDRLYEQVRQQKGVLDVVVANAGIVESATIDTATPEHFDKIFNINARGPFFTVQKALPLMTRGGSIVLLSSIMGTKGFPGIGAYAATKAAMRSFARTWTNELKDRRIRVNSLSPGAIQTPALDGQAPTPEVADQIKAMFSQMTPLGRVGRVEEIAAAALWLASDESSFSTGIDLVSDGGLVAI